MPRSISQQLDAVHPRMIAMRGEGLRRNPAIADDRRQQGEEIDTALKAAKITRQEAAYQLGYADASSIDRWIAGTENPNFAKLRTLGPRFRRQLWLAQAESIGGVRIEHVVRIPDDVEAAS